MFSSKKTRFTFIFFLNISNVQSFDFLPKNLIMRAEDSFKKYYHMIRILQQIVLLAIFEKFKIFLPKNTSIFLRKHIFFKKTPNFERFEKFYLFQSHSTANLLQFDEKTDIQTREQPMLARLARALSANIGYEKTHLCERNILLSIFSIWRKIINESISNQNASKCHSTLKKLATVIAYHFTWFEGAE